MNRGKAQILFNYTPGSVFLHEEGPWCMVTHLELFNEKRSYTGLLKALENYLTQWQQPDYFLFPAKPMERPDRFEIGSINKIYFDVYPLVLHCSKCKEMHWYTSPQNFREHNKEGRCRNRECNGALIQYPYVYVHENGDIQPLIAPRSPKDDYYKLFMKDTGRFMTSYWYYGPTGQTLGSGLGRRASRWDTPAVLNGKRVTKLMRGARLGQGEVFFSHTISLVDIDLDTLKKREDIESYALLQLGGYFRVPSFRSDKYQDLFAIKSGSNTSEKKEAEVRLEAALANVTLPPEVLAALQNYRTVNAPEESVAQKIVSEVKSYIEDTFELSIKSDQSLIEMNYCQYEIPSRRTLEDLIVEAHDAEQYTLHKHLTEAKQIAEGMGLKNLILHQEFPVLLAAVGYTRAKKNPGEALLRPFAPNPSNASKNKIPIPVTNNKNEAIMFSLEAKRLLAWLCLNGWLEKPSYEIDEIAATAFLYRELELYRTDAYGVTEQLVQENIEDPGLLAFQLLHTFTHVLIQAGKKYIGLDTDSLSEYLFPSTQTAAIYVAKHHEFSLGALVATFKHDLSRWLKASQEVTTSCLYDPVCITGNGACHACTYLKFSCRHFNRGLNRVLLIGGYYKPLNRQIFGYFSSEVSKYKENI